MKNDPTIPRDFDFPEALASNTFKVRSAKGFEHLFTVRDDSVSTLIEKIETLEDALLAKGWIPLEQNAKFPKKETEFVEGKVCPKDGGKLKIISSKKDGKTYWTCENGKYDYLTKTTSGCNFITTPEQFEVQKAKLTGQRMTVADYEKSFEI